MGATVLKITPDTNVLVRAMTEDDPRQSQIAQMALAEADLVALTLPTLCELVWVLAKGYNVGPTELAEGIRRLIDGDTVIVDRQAVDAGLAVLQAGGDFADGVIAHQGRRLGGNVFASFDRKATASIATHGGAIHRL